MIDLMLGLNTVFNAVFDRSHIIDFFLFLNVYICCHDFFYIMLSFLILPIIFPNIFFISFFHVINRKVSFSSM